jgi:hypothetical protein
MCYANMLLKAQVLLLLGLLLAVELYCLLLLSQICGCKETQPQHTLHAAGTMSTDFRAAAAPVAHVPGFEKVRHSTQSAAAAAAAAAAPDAHNRSSGSMSG